MEEDQHNLYIRDFRDRWGNNLTKTLTKTRSEAIRHKQKGMRAVYISSNIMSATNISNLLLQNIIESLPVDTQLDIALTWSKSLSAIPIFTRTEIHLHVRKCGKLKGKSISKTSVRGKLFKHWLFLSSDSVYTAFHLLYFYVKVRCKEGMKKELRNVRIQLCKIIGEVYKATWLWPAGKSVYCNHVIALLYETAEYSLNHLTEVPQKKACISVLRKWGQGGCKRECHKNNPNNHPHEREEYHPHYDTIHKNGIPLTLYDARLSFNQIKNVPFMLKLKSQPLKIDRNIGFSYHVTSDTPVIDENSLTKYGLQLLESPISYQLPPIDIKFSISSDLDNWPDFYNTSMEQEFPESLPVTTLDWDYEICEHAPISKHESLQKLKVNHTESQSIEKSTRKQRESKECKEHRKKQIYFYISPCNLY